MKELEEDIFRMVNETNEICKEIEKLLRRRGL
jgi:hypothetical protein